MTTPTLTPPWPAVSSHAQQLLSTGGRNAVEGAREVWAQWWDQVAARSGGDTESTSLTG